MLRLLTGLLHTYFLPSRFIQRHFVVVGPQMSQILNRSLISAVCGSPLRVRTGLWFDAFAVINDASGDVMMMSRFFFFFFFLRAVAAYRTGFTVDGPSHNTGVTYPFGYTGTPRATPPVSGETRPLSGEAIG